jgi:cytochrome b
MSDGSVDAPGAEAPGVDATAVEAPPPRRVLVWDLPVRVMHWSLVLAVCGSWATQELEGDWFRYHVWCGYTVLLLVTTRLLWGFVGTRHARFGNFLRGPRAILGYLRGGAQYVGHNPLGALMVVALLLMLAVQAITGLFANDQIMNTGPLFGYVSNATSDRITSIHGQLFDVLLAAIALHVAAAFVYLFLKRENLILPMFTGRKAAAQVPSDQAISSSRSWLALLILALLSGVLYWVLRNAPEASLFMF